MPLTCPFLSGRDDCNFKVLTHSALQVDFLFHLHFFLKNAKTKVLSRPKPSVNILRTHSGNADGVNTSEIIIVTLRDLQCHRNILKIPNGFPKMPQASTLDFFLRKPFLVCEL